MRLSKEDSVSAAYLKADPDERTKREHRRLRWLIPITGLLSLAWFLLRVIPKPSRAKYPCQRAAFPLAWGFVVWLLGPLASVAAWKKGKAHFAERRRRIALACVAISMAAMWLVVIGGGDKLVLADTKSANSPIGVAQGTNPGRVVWVHDPAATDWEGPGDGHWWQSPHTDQAVVNRMLSRSIRELTGESRDSAAWDKLFRYINRKRGKGDVGYKTGEKLAIKVNFVGLIWRGGGVNPDNYNLESQRDYMNTSPQVIRAVLGQLVNTVGVAQSDISVGDSLAYFPNEYYNILHNEFPDVRYMDYAGKFNRIQVRRAKDTLYWSSKPQGVAADHVPVYYAEAEYMINLANLKAHTGAGVTLCAKNHYGSVIRWPAEGGYYDLHTSGFSTSTGRYRALVDLMGYEHTGGKTVLYLIDGLYSGVHPRDQAPSKWNSQPFNGDWTSSVLASQDPVAIDSVAFDFLWEEWDDYPHQAGADDYLHEAALANNPPSKTFYDPNHSGDVERLPSLGVHEHWNGPEQKKYSRNLGTGNGIELIAVEGAGPMAFAVERLHLSGEEPLQVRWTDMGPTYEYSVEAADSLTEGWSLVQPEEQWPTLSTDWSDSSISTATMRFYRIKTEAR
jgi:uncharacterized protein (DUF362 family)